MGNLTALLDNIEQALDRAKETTEAPYDSSNSAYVEAAIEASVRQTMADILARSSVIAELVESGQVGIAGGVYDLASGRVTWLDS
jgi:carbonic anhydrase